MVMAYQERHIDTWNLGTPVRGNASDYVESQSLSQFTIRPPTAGRKRVVLAYVKSKYHDGEDGKIFQRFQDYRPGPLFGLFIITTFHVFFGCDYVVRVIDCDQTTGDLQNVEFEVRSKRSYDEQQKLVDTIWNLVDPGSMVDGKLFRDIDLSYHPELRITDSTITGTIKPRQRSKSGHPFNIGFDRVPVLHMSTSFTQDSWYASTRVTIPPECIFDEEMALLLTGMHCYDTNGAHYVDLMLVKIGSTVYNDLIKDGARRLDIRNNPFFTYNPETKEIKCASKMKLRERQNIASTLVVEIALAEKEVHLVNAPVHPVHLIERSNRCPRANTDCKMCFPMKEEVLGSICLSEQQLQAVLSTGNSSELLLPI